MTDLLRFAGFALAAVVLTAATVGCFALSVGMGVEIALFIRAAIRRDDDSDT